MNRFLLIAIGVLCCSCGPEQRSADRSLGGTTLLSSTPSARQVAQASIRAGEIQVDPCQEIPWMGSVPALRIRPVMQPTCWRENASRSAMEPVSTASRLFCRLASVIRAIRIPAPRSVPGSAEAMSFSGVRMG